MKREVRNPKAEGRRKAETRRPRAETFSPKSNSSVSDFGLRTSFGLRPSVFGFLFLLAAPLLAQLPTPPAFTSTNIPTASPAMMATNAIEAIHADPRFQPFTNMVLHSPFLPSGASAVGSSSPSAIEGAAFAASLRLTGFYIQGGNAEASLEDRSESDKKYFVRLGDVMGDTEIKGPGFDLPTRAVYLQKGEQHPRLEYENEAPPLAPSTPGRPGTTPPGFPPPAGTSGAFRPPTTPPAMQPQRPTAPAPTAGAGGDSSGRDMRRRNRQQTVERLKQMLQKTTDQATQQRLQSMITMLERADAQDAAESGNR